MCRFVAVVMVDGIKCNCWLGFEVCSLHVITELKCWAFRSHRQQLRELKVSLLTLSDAIVSVMAILWTMKQYLC